METYYSKHKDERIAYQKEYYLKNREKALAYNKKYHLKRKLADPSYRKSGKPRIRPKKVKVPKPTPKPRLIPEPRRSKYDFKDASFIVSLD